jgi:DNA-binding beta-propeller fold protein YncE
MGIAFDSAGNLYVANGGGTTVTVVPAATTTIFGQSFTVDTAATLSAATGLDSP